jgi:endoglucanase
MGKICLGLSGLGGWLVAGALLGCGAGRPPLAADTQASWSAFLDDGDASTVSAGAGVAARPAPVPPSTPVPAPPRTCAGGACAGIPLALWTFDDCNAQSAQLADTATSSPIQHPAFRSLDVACVTGRDNLAVRLAGREEVVYAPDQPDFVFDGGLTVAAWINPDHLAGTQTIVRKRLDGSSAFLLALDDKRLIFVLRLTNGHVVGVSAPVQPGRYTHVTATYDGQQAVLYLDGAPAAHERGAGTIAAGAGPIFIGNDADGRRLTGVIDSVWLNTLAAPADAIGGIACVRQAPIVTLSPAMSLPTPAGTAAAFDLAVTNPSDPLCPVDSYQLFGSFPPPISGDLNIGFLSVAPGQTAHQIVNVSAAEEQSPGPYPFRYYVLDTAQFALQAFAQATLVVTPAAAVTATGCAVTPAPPVAPGGYYTNGNTVCTADGRAHTFHGVDRPSLEWSSVGLDISRGDFALMSTWNANVVRIALNQDFWLPGSSLTDPQYPALVDDAVAWAEMAGMDVILDLHWSDRGVLGSCNPAGGCQQLMPDANSSTFWSQVAARYKGDGRVAFELYNEPHDVGWDIWRNGGTTSQGWQAVGMQTLYDSVRATGAQNLVVIGGLDWAYDLSGVPANRIDGYNILYATHPYTTVDGSIRPPEDWSRAWGFLTRTDPVVVTEFGVLNDIACTTDYPSQVIHYADTHLAGWTSWAWYPGGCTFPAIIDDWSGTPSPTGTVVKNALIAYAADPPASPPLPSPGPARAVEYLFDRGTEGWFFSNYDDPTFLNLDVRLPPGGASPTLSFNAAEGDPGPTLGALQVTAPFTGLDQYVDAIVGFAQPGLNLTGQTLTLRVKRVSGAFGGLQFHASSGPSYVYGAAPFVGDLPIGEWVSVTLNLGDVTSVGYDASQIIQLGVQVFSGFSNSGGAFVDSGDTVLEIDTVTD